jgi:regulator of nonsense transcripts 1
MIQFSKPRRPLNQPDRFGFGQDNLGGGMNGADLPRRADGPTRFDQSFYSAVGSIPSDAQSVRSQATFNSGLPPFGPGQFSGRSYASCRFVPTKFCLAMLNDRFYDVATISQDLMSQDPNAMADDASSIAGSIAFSQADRIRRNPNGHFASDYKSIPQDDDARSQVSLSTQITDF